MEICEVDFEKEHFKDFKVTPYHIKLDNKQFFMTVTFQQTTKYPSSLYFSSGNLMSSHVPETAESFILFHIRVF